MCNTELCSKSEAECHPWRACNRSSFSCAASDLITPILLWKHPTARRWRGEVLVQIVKVNKSHFPAYERQFLSHFCKLTEALLRFGDFCAELMEWQLFHFGSLRMRGAKKRRRHFRAPHTAGGLGGQVWHWTQHESCSDVSASPSAIKHWCGMKSEQNTNTRH